MGGYPSGKANESGLAFYPFAILQKPRLELLFQKKSSIIAVFRKGEILSQNDNTDCPFAAGTKKVRRV